MTITLPELPEDVEHALQERANRENKTVEATILDVLRSELMESAGTVKKTCDLTGIAGLGLIDDEMRAVFEEQRQIDPEIWK